MINVTPGTPTGVAEKAVLTRRFLQRKMAEYEKLWGEIEALKLDTEQIPHSFTEPIKAIALHKTQRIARLTHEAHTGGEVRDALQAEPEGLDAGFTVSFACQEAADHGHASHHGVQAGRLLGQGLVRQHVGRSYLVGVENQRCRQVRAGAALAHQPRNAPGHHHVETLRPLDLLQAGQLHGFNPGRSSRRAL